MGKATPPKTDQIREKDDMTFTQIFVVTLLVSWCVFSRHVLIGRFGIRDKFKEMRVQSSFE